MGEGRGCDKVSLRRRYAHADNGSPSCSESCGTIAGGSGGNDVTRRKPNRKPSHRAASEACPYHGPINRYGIADRRVICAACPPRPQANSLAGDRQCETAWPLERLNDDAALDGDRAEPFESQRPCRASRLRYERDGGASPRRMTTGPPVCPLCGEEVIRIRRRIVDRLQSLIRPVHRYRCRCGWEGNLRYRVPPDLPAE